LNILKADYKMSKASILAHEEIKPKKLSIEQQIYSLSEMHDKGIVCFDAYGSYRVTHDEREKREVEWLRMRDKYEKWKKQGVKNGWLIKAE